MPNNDESNADMPGEVHDVPIDDDEEEEEEPIQTRLDVTAALLKDMTEEEKQIFVDTISAESYPSVTTVHLSGRELHTVLSDTQIETVVKAIGRMYNVTEFFCFQGDAPALTADLLATSIPPNATVLMLWHLRTTPESLAGAMRQHVNLTRVTLNFPCPRNTDYQLEWGCLDVYAMAFCSMEQLEVLQIRCVASSDYHTQQQIHITQEDSIITPEALTVLLNSPTIEHLYLENCGLLDDHMDVVAAELPNNKKLASLDLQHNNLFTEDVWYTTGRMLPKLPPQFTALDISCSAAPTMSDEAGRALANGMQHNKTLLSLELEGTWHHYHNEFCIPEGHKNKEWMTDITHQLRLNRAYAAAYAAGPPKRPTSTEPKTRLFPPPPKPPSPLDLVQSNASNFVVALSSVSDHVGGLYHFLRTYPSHCDRLRPPAPYVEPVEDTSTATMSSMPSSQVH